VDYDPFKDMPNVKSTFMTDRGSTYALFEDQTSQRNRSGEGHSDKTTGMQQRSGKTVFLDRDSMNRVGSMFQREELATKFQPILDSENKPTGRAKLELIQDHTYRPSKLVQGKFVFGEPITAKAGTVIAEVPYSTKPAVGMHPVEIMRSESPIGDKGRGIHFGSKITEVIERGVERAKDRIASGRVVGGGGMNPMDIEKVPGKRPLKMAKGGMVDKAVNGGWKII
jgi:hypothetical protein